jgi:hypothetical protein
VLRIVKSAVIELRCTLLARAPVPVPWQVLLPQDLSPLFQWWARRLRRLQALHPEVWHLLSV